MESPRWPEKTSGVPVGSPVRRTQPVEQGSHQSSFSTQNQSSSSGTKEPKPKQKARKKRLTQNEQVTQRSYVTTSAWTDRLDGGPYCSSVSRGGPTAAKLSQSRYTLNVCVCDLLRLRISALRNSAAVSRWHSSARQRRRTESTVSSVRASGQTLNSPMEGKEEEKHASCARVGVSARHETAGFQQATLLLHSPPPPSTMTKLLTITSQTESVCMEPFTQCGEQQRHTRLLRDGKHPPAPANFKQ